MRHTRESVIERAVSEFERLDAFVSHLSEDDWRTTLGRPEDRDPWTVKDALAHITYWKWDTARKARRQRLPPDMRGKPYSAVNHLVYQEWRYRSPAEVFAWHRSVQEDVLAAMREAPDAWFDGRERKDYWPFDLDGHSENHRVNDIERALNTRSSR